MTFHTLLHRFFHPRKMSLLLSVLFLMFTLPAWAELGANVVSVQADQAKLKGTLHVTSAGNYQIHEIQTAQGAVREYVAPSGNVFGVAWSGQFPPDLRQILGTYFDQYVNVPRGKRMARGPVTLETPNFVIERGGHQGFFFGRAFVPQMVPQGVSAASIK